MNAFDGYYSALTIYGYSVQVDNCRFIGNRSNHRGGAISIEWGYTTITDCVFIDNQAEAGGAIGQFGGDFNMSGCVFVGNTAETGGALYSDSAYTSVFSNCTFHANGATTGGAVYIKEPFFESLTIDASIISGSLQGEGIYWDGLGLFFVTNCDIFGNAGGDWVGNIADLQAVDGNFALDPLFCDAEGGDFTLHVDSPCLAENSPGGVLVGAFGLGCATSSVPQLQSGFALHNYPNPCNPRTTIGFTLERPQPVRVEIFGLDGRRIVQLADRIFDTGQQSLAWDGQDASGNAVASGTYIVQLTAADGAASQKIMLIR